MVLKKRVIILSIMLQCILPFSVQGMEAAQKITPFESIISETIMMPVALYLMGDSIYHNDPLSYGVNSIINSLGLLNKGCHQISTDELLWKNLFNRIENHYKERGLASTCGSMRVNEGNKQIRKAFEEHLRNSSLVNGIPQDPLVVQFFRNPTGDTYYLQDTLKLFIQTNMMTEEQKGCFLSWAVEFIGRQKTEENSCFRAAYLANLIFSCPVNENSPLNIFEKKGVVERNAWGETRLIRAAREGNLEAMKQLLTEAENKKTLLEAQDGIGMDALSCAIWGIWNECALYLLGEGAPYNQLGKTGASSIDHAIGAKMRPVIKDLLNRLKEEKATLSGSQKIKKNAITQAAMCGRTDIFNPFFSMDPFLSLESCGGNWSSPLALAAFNNHAVLVRKMLPYWIENKSAYKQKSPFIYAARGGAYDVVSLFLKEEEYRAHLSEQDLKDALVEAAEWGRLRIVKLLCEHGVSIRGKHSDSGTALECAIKAQHEHVIRYILDHPATTYNDCYRILKAAKNFEWLFVHLVEEAIKNKAKDDFEGRTAILEAARIGDVEALAQWVAGGRSLELVDLESGMNLMEIALSAEQAESVEFLLNHGIKAGSDWESWLETKEAGSIATLLFAYGIIPTFKDLSWAIHNENKELVRAMLNHSSSQSLVNQQYIHGSTPLIEAVYTRDKEIVQMLLEHGADPSIRNDEGSTAGHIAVENGMDDIKAMLEAKERELVSARTPEEQADIDKKKEKMDQFVMAAENGDLDEVQRLVAEGVDINGYHSDIRGTALIAAALEGHNDIVYFLLKQPGINVQLRSAQIKCNLLMAACCTTARVADKKDLVSYLVEVVGLDVNEGAFGLLPLTEAIIYSPLDIATYLLDQGAKVNGVARATRGTALMMASLKGNIAAVNLLLSRDADATLKDRDGYDAIDYARKGGHQAVVDILEKHLKKEPVKKCNES